MEPRLGERILMASRKTPLTLELAREANICERLAHATFRYNMPFNLFSEKEEEAIAQEFDEALAAYENLFLQKYPPPTEDGIEKG